MQDQVNQISSRQIKRSLSSTYLDLRRFLRLILFYSFLFRFLSLHFFLFPAFLFLLLSPFSFLFQLLQPLSFFLLSEMQNEDDIIYYDVSKLNLTSSTLMNEHFCKGCWRPNVRESLNAPFSLPSSFGFRFLPFFLQTFLFLGLHLIKNRKYVVKTYLKLKKSFSYEKVFL